MWIGLFAIGLLAPGDVPLTSISSKSVQVYWPDVKLELTSSKVDPSAKRESAIIVVSLNASVYRPDSCVDATIMVLPGVKNKDTDKVTVSLFSKTLAEPWLFKSASYPLNRAAYDKSLQTYAVILGDVCDSDTRDYRGNLNKPVIPESQRRARQRLPVGTHEITIVCLINDKVQSTTLLRIKVIPQP